MTEFVVNVDKDENSEGPIPTVWRSIFCSVIESFVKKDYSLSGGVPGVSSVSNETANHIREYIDGYGEELIQLPIETWESSVCIWMDGYWDVLIDLWTAGEGPSDLVLGAKVTEKTNGYRIDIGMVYVP